MKNLAAWTQTPVAPLADGVVQYVSINEERERVTITVRNNRDEVVSAELTWAEYVELVSEANLSIANHRRSSRA
jgi:hypothetical protein